MGGGKQEQLERGREKQGQIDPSRHFEESQQVVHGSLVSKLQTEQVARKPENWVLLLPYDKMGDAYSD